MAQYKSNPINRPNTKQYGDKKHFIEYASQPTRCMNNITVYKEYYKQRHIWALSRSDEYSWFVDGDYPEEYNEAMTEEEQQAHIEKVAKEKAELKAKWQAFLNKLKFWRG